MNEAFLFVFGLIATILAIGPLVIAGISERRLEEGQITRVRARQGFSAIV